MSGENNKIYIGTSGWVYPHWDKVFYPSELKNEDRLKYFSQYFNTTEINYSFYRLPKPEHYKKWHQETPNDFVFSLKVSRFITHLKKLKNINQPWQKFLNNALNLKSKLGPFLFQFPTNFKLSELNYAKIESFLVHSKTGASKRKESLQYAFEFRHNSWFNSKIVRLFKEHDVALVSADSSDYPKSEEATASFVYLRMHGSQELFPSDYSEKELKLLSQRIKQYQRAGLTVYCYFNNDSRGYAVKNAQRLKNFLN
jgi:uncharacterized protein YecE (DUF72 family)